MTTTTTKPDVKVPTLKQEVLDLSTKIEAAMAIDVTTGIVTTESNIYETSLPEGISLDLVNRIETHNNNFIAGAAHAVGRIGVNAMKDNTSLNSAETLIRMGGKNELGLTVERERTYRNPKDQENPVVKNGVVSITYDVVADNDAGQVKAARQIINGLAASALKGQPT